MRREFMLPDLGPDLSEAQIIRWHVAPGDRVADGAILCEVEAAMAAVDINVPFEGTVSSLDAEPGDSVGVGKLLAVFDVDQDSDDAPESDAAPEAAADSDDPPEQVLDEASEQPDPSPHQSESENPSDDEAGEESGDDDDEEDAIRHRAMPSIRRMAREYHVDLDTVTGTGPHGRITRADVQAVIDQRPPPDPQELTDQDTDDAPPQAETSPPQTPVMAEESEETSAQPEHDSAGPSVEPEAGDDDEVRPTAAESHTAGLTRSWREVPHVFARVEIDASQFIQAREILAARFDQRIPMEFLLIRAVLPALKDFPEFNATLDGDYLTRHEHYDIGVAVDTDRGHAMAVLHSADEIEVADLADRLTILMKRASLGEASPAELTGATFSVNNIGARGGVMETAIIPYGTTATLSTGRIVEKAVVRTGQVVVAPMMEVTLSFDRRAIDGGLAQRFMNAVKENLEQPLRFLL